MCIYETRVANNIFGLDYHAELETWKVRAWTNTDIKARNEVKLWRHYMIILKCTERWFVCKIRTATVY
jgi:hypothetical protein